MDDIGFLRKMVDDVTAEYGINKHKHVYWSGLSNGCAMAQMMAAEAPDIVAAVACTSHYLMKYPTEFVPLLQDNYLKNGPVPVLEIHGSSDDVVGFGYPTGVALPTGPWYKDTGITAFGNRETWASMNMCKDYLSQVNSNLDGSASLCTVPASGGIAQYTIETSTKCLGGAEASLLAVLDVGHVPYPSVDARSPDVTNIMWNFMKRYPDNPEERWIPTTCVPA